jgi:hypothetical protein
MMIMGRSKDTDRWIVIMGSEFPTEIRKINSLLGRVNQGFQGNVSHWCLIGGQQLAQGRTVIALFSDKWMVYDRYGTFSFSSRNLMATGGTLQASSSSLEPAAAAGDAGPYEGPVPNTLFKKVGDPKALDGRGRDPSELVLTPDALKYYETCHDKRRELADDVRAEAGDCEFQLGESLRVTWVPQQRADKALSSMFSSHKQLSDGFRLAPDGLLERCVHLRPPVGAKWVPIVPDGRATANLAWKKWLFLQCHVGVLGAHRSGDKTHDLLHRQVWWRGMKADIDKWWKQCLTCLRFRRMP